MKKFTVNFIVFFLIIVISVFGSLSVYADEIVISEEQTASIPAEEFWEGDNSGLSSGYSMLSNENFFMFYDQLDSNNKAAYNVMKAWLDPRTDTLTISLPEPAVYETDSANMSDWSDEQSDEFWNLLLSCIKDGKTALMLDYPELFWFDENQISVTISYTTGYNFRKGCYTIKVNKIFVTASVYEAYTDVPKAEEYIELLKNSIDSLKVEGEDNYTKVKFIHDYIGKTVKYNMQSPYRNTALGVFIEPFEVICEGYAEAVKLLCDKENIPCISVVGNIDPLQKTGHMWNYIQMEDGKWYGLDCTWDDLDSETEPVKYQYFLTGAASFLKGHTPDSKYVTPNFTYPELSEEDYKYDPNTTPVITTAITTTTTTTTTTHSTTVTTTIKPTETTVSASDTPVIAIKGDFNKNNKLDIGDIVMLQKKLIKLADIEKNDFQHDLNDDKKLNVWDFIILKRLLLN